MDRKLLLKSHDRYESIDDEKRQIEYMVDYMKSLIKIYNDQTINHEAEIQEKKSKERVLKERLNSVK